MKQFGGSLEAIGTLIRIDGRAARVVGVAERGFPGLFEGAEMDGYVPLSNLRLARRTERVFTDRTLLYLTAVGRLRPGVSLAQARTVVDNVARRLEKEYPASEKGTTVRVMPEPLARPMPIRFFSSILRARDGGVHRRGDRHAAGVPRHAHQHRRGLARRRAGRFRRREKPARAERARRGAGGRVSRPAGGRRCLRAESSGRATHRSGIRAGSPAHDADQRGQVGYDSDRASTFFGDLARRVRAVPGVRRATLSSSVPMGYIFEACPIEPESSPVSNDRSRLSVPYNSDGTDYFTTLGLPIQRGRAFGEHDILAAPRVTVVNETLAARLRPGQDPIGKRLALLCTSAGSPWEVIGVAKDSKYLAVFERQLPYLYLPAAQTQPAMQVLQIRSALPPGELSARVRREIDVLDPEMPVADIRTMNQGTRRRRGGRKPVA